MVTWLGNWRDTKWGIRADEAKRKKSKAEDLSGFFPLSDADFFGSDNVVVVDGTLEE